MYILSPSAESSSFSAGIQDPWELCPLPVIESERILSLWLMDSGFEVSRTPLENGKVLLQALKGSESWQIKLRPYSPLASYLLAEYAINGRHDMDKIKELWAYTEEYLKGLHSEGRRVDHEIPAAVLSRNESVVCIRASIKGEVIQFSGFIIDRKGLIVSTAHDLEGVQEIEVILNNGQGVKGRLVRRDSYRDLSLIDIDAKVSSSITLPRGRNIPGTNERVYSIGCPLNHKGSVYTGIINRSFSRVNDLLLLQVNMETLPGSSGSPVFDHLGHLVGVVKGRFRGKDARGFLIPVETVIDFLKRK